MADKKSWRDYSKSKQSKESAKESTSSKNTSSWRDYSKLESESGGQTNDWRSYSNLNTTSIVSNNIVNRVNSWLQNHSSYISDYQTRYADRKGNYEDAYVSDSAEWLNNARQQKSTYDTEADAILSYLDQYKGYLDTDWAEKIKSTIKSAKGTQGQILDAYRKDNEWWSGFGSEELVNAYGSAEEAYKYHQRADGYSKKYDGKSSNELDEILSSLDDGEEKDWVSAYRSGVYNNEMLQYDTELAIKELESMENVYKEAESIALNMGMGGDESDAYMKNQIRDIIGKFSNGEYYSMADLEKRISDKKRDLNNAKRIQKGVELASVADKESANYDPEFSNYAGYVDSGKTALIPDYKDLAYDAVNSNVDSSNLAVGEAWGDKLFGLVGLQGGEKERLDAIKYMKPEEINLYNYYYNKFGYDKAEEYLDTIMEGLNTRIAQENMGLLRDNTLLEFVFGAAAGLDQFTSGVRNFFNTEDAYIPPSSTQITSGMVREDLSDVDLKWYNIKEGEWDDAKIFGSSLGQGIYDLTTTGFNMAPSILASSLVGMVNPVAGAVTGNALMGVSAAGNAYADAINRGFDKAEARFYSTAIGASEALLGYALGGISKLGGVSPKLAKAVAGIDNGLLRFSLLYGGKIASEGIEEGLQEILDPILQNAIFNTDEDINWSEVAYSALLGGLSAGVLELGGTIRQTNVEQKLKKRYDGKTESIIQEGLESDVNSESYKLAEEYKAKTDGGKALTGAEIRQLLVANKEQITAKDMQKIQKAAEERLTALGQTEDVGKIAEIATKWATGQNLTSAEKKLLTHSQYGSRVANEMLPKNIQSGGYTSGWIENLGTRQVNQEAYNKELFDKWRAAVDEIAKMNDPATYKALEDRVDEKDKLTVSKTGKATIRESNEEIDLSKAEVTNFITDKKTGKITDMTLNVDGKEVKASEIDYADGVQSYLFSAVQKIENMTPGAATTFIRDYDPSSGVSVGAYLNGIDEAFTYGYHNYSEADMQAGNFTIDLSKEQAKGAYLLGQTAKNASKTAKTDAVKRMRTAVEAEAEKAIADGKEAPKAKKMTITYNEGNGKIVDFDKAGLKLTSSQKAAPALAKVFHEMGLGTNFELFASYVNKKGDRVFLDENGVERKAPSGVYRMKDGTVRIDLNAYNGRGLTLDVMAHELTHFMQQWSDTKYKALADFLIKTYEKTDMTMHERVIREQARLKGVRGEDVSYNEAFDEVVANAMSKMLADGKVMERLNELKAQDMELAQKLWEGLKKFLNKFFRIAEKQSALFHDAADLMELKAEFKQMQQMWAEAFVEASENFQASLIAKEAGIETMPVEDGTMYSYSSLAEAAGFMAVENEDGTRSFTRDGKKVSEVTVEDIDNSPIGAFINFSLEMKDITADDAKRQKEMFAQICTMACKTNDFAMTMQFVGSAVFTGMKANADKQYGTTYDFPSICTKTQAVIDAMSAKMKSLGRGLTTDEIVKLYDDVFASGNPVPCPECYVFSRWIGIGGLLDNIKKYQDYYGDMAVEDVAAEYRKMKAEVSKFADEQGISFGKAKGALTSKLTNEFNKLTEKIEKAENQGEKVKPSDRQRLAELEPMMNTVKGMTWLENVYFADSSLKKVNPKFRVPNEILFDLNNGEAFATQYKEAWAFRTTQGAGYGKAITPYAEARLGEGVLVTNNTTNAIKGRAQGTLDNYFLRQMGKLDKQSRDALKRARLKQKIQAFIGGQRFQSTSDARYENASDYLLAALEMQAMGGMVQVYTKVDGAVPAFSAWGFSINQSLMPLNGGLDADGNVKDTAVGGIKPEVAFENRKKHESAGTITIGVNDNHIRAMFKQWVRDFIIPYHASGGKAAVVAEFRRIQEGKDAKGEAVRSTDYSRTQSDKVLSDEVLRWQGKTDAQIQRIHEIRTARIAILTGGNVNMTVVRSNRFLSALYDKLNGGEWDGVKLAKSKVESQIYPNEFWDQTVSYEDSAKITKDYLEYCEDLGFLHRFSGMVPSNGRLVPVNGYDQNGNRVQLTDIAYKYDANGNKTSEVEPFFWKVLTDRRMYDNNGKYLPQKVVTLNDTTADTVTGFAKNNQGRQYDKAKADALAKKIAGEQYSSQETDADKKRITIGMPDSERTEILQTKVITAEVYENQADKAVERERVYLESGQLGLIEAALERIADEFGVFTGYDIKDVGVKLEFSKSNLHESVSKKITPEVIAKLMPVLKTAVENAIGVESHTNRYFYDTDIVRFDNLVGGYVEGEKFIPVRFGLKHRRNGEALLYVIIDQQKVPLNKTKAEVVRIAGTQSVQPEVPRSAFKVSIADIIPFVNSGDLLRYLPDDMLTENQKQIKWDAIADTIVRTNNKNDAKYAKYIREGKIRVAKQMVKAAAKDAGYTTGGYHGSRTPGFTVVDKYSWLWLARDKAVASGYGTHNTVDSKGKPHDENGVYAMLYNLGNNLKVYADGASWGELPVTEDEYPGVYVDEYTGEITTNAMAEWAERNGYDSITFADVDDGGLTTVDVVFNPNRDVKSADPITYDDNGNIIPISERFKKDNDDIRYSSQETDLDSEGKKLTKEQMEFFKDSKLRDESGRLIIMYHGTNNPNFTVFDPEFSDDKTSLFFTSDPDVANTYTNAQDYGRDVDPYNLITKDSSAEQFNAAQEKLGGGLRVVKITPEWISEMKRTAADKCSKLIIEAETYAYLLEKSGNKTLENHADRIRRTTSKSAESLTASDISSIRSALFDASQAMSIYNKDASVGKKAREQYKVVYDLLNVEHYVRAAKTPESAIGKYTYTETNSMLPFAVATTDRGFTGNTFAGSESEAVAQAIDRSKWVKEHHFGNRYKVYLNLTNPYIIDAGTDISGKMDHVFLSRRYSGEGWTVELESKDNDLTKHMTTDEFEAFVENAFDAETKAKIKAQIEADNQAYQQEWGDLDSDYVDHNIELKNVNLNYIEPGNWNSLNFNGMENARTRDVTAWAKDNGYDGVIFKNMKDTGGYAFMKGRGASTIAVAFKSDQVKSVDNKNPTSDPDMRYSTQETDNIDNRSLLANAFEGITQNSKEYELIQEYKGRIKILNEYEEKLAKLNAEIRKILFDPDTERDAKKLKELQDEAKKVAENINRNDKKLLSLEASEPLRKVIERERKKESQKTKDHVKTLIKNKKDRAEQTELRHKIRKTVRDLDKILNRGNKKQNVKEDMKGFVSKALELADYLFTDHITNDELIRRGVTVRMTPEEAALVKETEEILTKLYDEAYSLTDEEFTNLDAKRKANEERLRDLLKAQRNEGLNTPVYNLFNDLVTEYASLKNSSQESVKAAYDEVLENSLRAFMGDEDRVKILKNMRVADMTTEELNWLYRAYTMVLTNVRNANKFHAKGITESIEQVVGQIAGDFGSRKIPEKKLAIAAQKLANKIGWDYEKLYYALDRIGSEAFTKLIMNIADSENIVMQDIIEAMAFRDQIVKNYGFNNWAVNKEIDREFMDNTGKKFKMTLGQMMSLYAYSRREGAWDHIEYGGFVFGEAALTNPRPADSYKLSKEQCEAITSLLTKEQKSYVEDMQKFLSETMGAKGNEVSMQLYGIKMFGEKNYFPIHIAGQFKAQAQESQAKAAAGFGSMSNAGFTHAQNPNAKAPFVLEGFNEVWADHVNEMSRYHGTVPALEDLRRVMNRSTYSDSVSESQSIKQLMENHYGKEAVEYFDNLYREANSGAITDKLQKKPKKLLSLFRKNSVAYSLSVLVQQPASLVRAYAMIDKKYFGFKGFGTITSGVAKAVSSKWNPAYANAYNEMMKYAPGVTMAKEIGGFDTATGGSIRSTLLDTNKSLKQKWNTGTALEKGKAVLDVVDNNAIANLPNVADKIAWIEIWNACKRETVAKRKDLAANSEEFMQAVGERFTEVIRATQVYDSIFAKSPMLKSKNLAVQYLVSFMNEPNTVANMAESAVRSATRGDWKQGVRTGAAVIYSIIFTNVLKSIIYAMRDDDEDESYIEKYIEAITGGMMDDFNPLNYIPIARDAWSIAQGYDVERADMAIVSDAIGAANNVIKAAATDKDDMTEDQLIELDKKQTEANWQLVEALAAFLGIPVKNIRREIEGVIDHAKIAFANAGQTTASSLWDKVGDAVIDSIPFMQSKNTKQDKLYDAIISGDQTYLGRIKATYKTEDAYHSAVRKALRENDSRIHDAAQARYDGKTEEYKRIFREIQKEGKFTFDEIMDAVNAEENAIKNKLEPGKVTSTYSASDFVQAVSMGDTGTASAAMDDIIATHVANGKTQSEAEAAFASSVATSTHEALSAGLLDEAGAENMLVEYAGKDEGEAASKVSYWAFCDDNPQYDYFSESNVKDYREFAAPANISLEVYAQFLNGTKGLADIKDKWGDVEVTKRDQVLEVIDSLPLTWEQKDALYLAAGYSESKIWDVPW